MFCRLVALFSVFILASCGSAPTKEPEQAIQQANELTEQQQQAIREAKRIEARRELVNSVLTNAAEAMKRGRYTRPLDDNAFDYFQAVLILEPKNSDAIQGLENIQLNYLDMIRDAAGRGLARDSRAYFDSLASTFPQSKLLPQAEELIKNIKPVKRFEPKKAREQEDDVLEKIDLPAAALSQQDEEIALLLAEIAEKVETTQARVIIYARSDSEGRWIYSQLKELANGYRIRGDIRIHNPPYLKLLAPL